MTKLIPVETIANKILFLRNEKVLMDRDLAELYGVETMVLNQAVSRNIRRFPPDFMFTLTRDEIMRISQIVISSEIKYSKRVPVKRLPSEIRSEFHRGKACLSGAQPISSGFPEGNERSEFNRGGSEMLLRNESNGDRILFLYRGKNAKISRIKT